MSATERRPARRGGEEEGAGGGAATRRGTSPGTGATDGGARRGGFGLLNWVVLLVAVAAIVVGYWLLDRGSITAAPILLVLGYVVLIPVGLLLGRRRSEDSV